MSDFLNKMHGVLDDQKADREQAEAIAGLAGDEAGAVAGNLDEAIDQIQGTED